MLTVVALGFLSKTRWDPVRICSILILALPVAALAAAIAARLPTLSWIEAFCLGFLAGLLAAVAATDLREFRIPDSLSLAVLLSGLGVGSYRAIAFADWPAGVQSLAGAVVGPSALYLVSVIYLQVRSQRGLGLGDVKLAAGAGAWVGITRLPECLLLACLIALTGVLLKVWRHGTDRVNRTTMLPFGAAMAPAIWMVAAMRLANIDWLG